MTNEELVEMLQEKWDRKIAQELCLNNEGIIRNIASRFKLFAEMDDIMQEGYIALCVAAKNYDSSKGVKFITYASECITCSIKNYISEYGHSIRIPRNYKMLINKYQRFIKMYVTRNGSEPNDEEIRNYMCIGKQLLDDIRKTEYIMQVSSLDVCIDEHNSTLGELIPASEDDIKECIESIENEELKAVLWGLVDATGEYEGKVIRSLYMDEKTVSETAEDMGKSETEILRLKNKSLRSLKMKKEVLKPYISDELRYSLGVKGGYKWFINTGTSSTEYTALKLMEEDTRHQLKKAYI